MEQQKQQQKKRFSKNIQHIGRMHGARYVVATADALTAAGAVVCTLQGLCPISPPYLFHLWLQCNQKHRVGQVNF